MKVYLLVDPSKPLIPENILLVGRKSDAEKIIADGYAIYYEEIEVLGRKEVDEFYKRNIGRG